MPDAIGDDAAWLCALPHKFRRPIRLLTCGELPANVALMHILIAATDEREVRDFLSAAPRALNREGAASAGIAELDRLFRAHPGAFGTVRLVAHGVPHDATSSTPTETIAMLRRAFDEVALVTPEGAVALYSLGSPELLRAATREVAQRVREWGVTGGGKSLLEIGCGIGRFEEALASEFGTLVGIDVSGSMLREARRRCAGRSNVFFAQTSGADLSAFADASFDVVIAVDSFPYLVQAGVDIFERHFIDAARVLRPGGHLLIFNLSYREDLGADRADVARLSRERFRILRDGVKKLRSWDGAIFHLLRSG